MRVSSSTRAQLSDRHPSCCSSPLLQLQLVNEITTNGLTLVKDPYGNYVVQYVLDLPYPRMLANLILQFKTHLSELSTQKFSSNVVEKVLVQRPRVVFFCTPNAQCAN